LRANWQNFLRIIALYIYAIRNVRGIIGFRPARRCRFASHKKERFALVSTNVAAYDDSLTYSPPGTPEIVDSLP